MDTPKIQMIVEIEDNFDVDSFWSLYYSNSPTDSSVKYWTVNDGLIVNLTQYTEHESEEDHQVISFSGEIIKLVDVPQIKTKLAKVLVRSEDMITISFEELANQHIRISVSSTHHETWRFFEYIIYDFLIGYVLYDFKVFVDGVLVADSFPRKTDDGDNLDKLSYPPVDATLPLLYARKSSGHRLEREERVYRLAAALEAIELRAKHPEMTWKEVAKNIKWRYGTGKSALKTLEYARNGLRRIQLLDPEGLLPEAEEFRKGRKETKERKENIE